MNLLTIKDFQKLFRILFSLLCCFSLFINKTMACDSCGCFMGITPYDNQSSITLLHRYRSFGGYYGQSHPLFPEGSSIFNFQQNTKSPITSHQGNASDFEIYRSTEIRSRYFLSKKLELNVILPYISNTERYNGNTNTLTGIGDINIFAGYHLIRKLDQKKINQRLITGLGIKLATGKHLIENIDGLKFNNLMQPGTGSTDGFVYVNYLLGYKKMGISLNTMYKVNGKNAEDESFANSTSSFLNVFHQYKINKNLQVIPSIQFAYEYAAGEKYQGIKTNEHAMNNAMAGAGIDFFIKNITINAALQKNIWAAKDDHPMPSGRLVLGVTYNFNQLYYLLN